MSKFKAACLCNNIQFEADLVKDKFHVCHCGFCRQQSAGPFMGTQMKKMPEIKGETLGWYSSSEHGERGFCKQCGSSLFWRLREDHDAFCMVSVGALKDAECLELEAHIFVDNKPENYDFKDNCPRMTAEEVMAAEEVMKEQS